MNKIVKRLSREPIISRVGLAAVLNVLVISGVIDTGAAEGVEAAVLALVNAVTLVSARQSVTPNVSVHARKRV